MDTLLTRIEGIRVEKKLSMRQFDELCGLPNGTISYAMKRLNQFMEGKLDATPSFNGTSIEKILHRFPEYNGDWLLIGRGSRYIADKCEIQQANEPTVGYGLREMLKQVTNQLNEQTKINADLERKCSLLKIKCIESGVDVTSIIE